MGKLFVAGFGPGDAAGMTGRCGQALQNADVIVGYTGYIKLLRDILPEKDFVESGMTFERQRCLAAIRLAKDGKSVCLISSGDAGVYGMAGLALELLGNDGGVEVEVIPGVTAATGGSALLGAPIGHDFAVISLSDLLTPWELIAGRLKAAAGGDFAICIYNPRSRGRAEHLRRACDILLETLPEERLCGIARNIGREGQSATLLTLSELRDFEAGMTDTVFIGNSRTKLIDGRMVTPRGFL